MQKPKGMTWAIDMGEILDTFEFSDSDSGRPVMGAKIGGWCAQQTIMFDDIEAFNEIKKYKGKMVSMSGALNVDKHGKAAMKIESITELK